LQSTAIMIHEADLEMNFHVEPDNFIDLIINFDVVLEILLAELAEILVFSGADLDSRQKLGENVGIAGKINR
jgi:hypothetical protein